MRGSLFQEKLHSFLECVQLLGDGDVTYEKGKKKKNVAAMSSIWELKVSERQIFC